MSKKTGTAWLAMDRAGNWNLAGWSAAHRGNLADGDSAGSSIEALETDLYRLHKCVFELPDPPKEQGEGLELRVSETFADSQGVADK